VKQRLARLTQGELMVLIAGLLLIVDLLFLPWHSIPVSDRDLRVLESRGIFVDTTYTAVQGSNVGYGVAAVLLTAVVFAVTRRMAPERRALALLGLAEQLVDLAVPVDVEVDHVRGAADASVTLLEYGDFECPHCGEAEPAARAELADDQDLRFVWRHLPLPDVHPRAQLAAEAAEAAGEQDRFWEMHDVLMDHQEALTPRDLLGYADDLGLDVDRFRESLGRHEHVDRVARDVASADSSGVSGTPTFFVNGRRHHGAYDEESLRRAIKVARARQSASLGAGRRQAQPRSETGPSPCGT